MSSRGVPAGGLSSALSTHQRPSLSH